LGNKNKQIKQPFQAARLTPRPLTSLNEAKTAFNPPHTQKLHINKTFEKL
jgi:hypothetical protein